MSTTDSAGSMPSQRSRGRANVVDNPTLERDMSTSAVINRNHTDYSRRLSLKKAADNKTKEIEDLKCQVANLTNLVQSLLAASATVIPSPSSTN